VEYSGYTYSDIMVHFATAYKSSTDEADVIGTVFLIVWLLIIILGFIWIWFRYLRDLAKNIWRIQGMLNMIPAEIIHNNSKMKDKFMDGGLTKGLK
jgi:hypothetical protein